MRLIRVQGTSMWPVLKTGDLVFVEPMKRLSPGDLVLRNLMGRLTVHRLLTKEITKGDRTALADDDQPLEENVELVVGILPRRHIGRGKRLLLSPSRQGLFTKFQTFLSSAQMKAQSRPAKLFFLFGLIFNGHFLRLAIYTSTNKFTPELIDYPSASDARKPRTENVMHELN